MTNIVINVTTDAGVVRHLDLNDFIGELDIISSIYLSSMSLPFLPPHISTRSNLNNLHIKTS
jgi:hypothetical protein